MKYGFRIGFLPFHGAPNQRMKLTRRGGHSFLNKVFFLLVPVHREAIQLVWLKVRSIGFWRKLPRGS
jgi:hypothetical protein